MLNDFEAESRIESRAFKWHGVGPRDRYPWRRLGCRRIQIEPDGPEPLISQLNDVHAIAAAGAKDFSPF
jgi:hypothetical protein